MIISEKFKNKRPIISFEIYPPKREEALRDIDETLKILCELKPDYISVTFGAGGSSNNNKTIALAKKIKDDYGVEPLVHLTCLTYNKNEIDQFLRELQSQGLENILALRGDRNPNIAQKEDFFHASELTTYIKKNGNFCVAGACYPEGHPEKTPDPEPEARLSQTQNHTPTPKTFPSPPKIPISKSDEAYCWSHTGHRLQWHPLTTHKNSSSF